MSTNEFDRLLNEKFDAHDFPYDHAGWEKLSRQLPVSSKRKAIPFPWFKTVGIAAALAITIGGAAWYFNHHNANTIIIAENESLKTFHPDYQSQNKEEITQPNNKTIAVTHQTSQPVAAISHKQKNTYLKAVPAVAEQAIQNENSPLVAQEFLSHGPEVVQEISEKKVTAETRENIKFSQPVKNCAPELVLGNNNLFELKVKSVNRTLFSLAGGMNYGSMNAGYMAGINARQKLGKKLFVEGDLAVVNNKASESFTQQQQQIATLQRTPIDYKDANLLYVAFNPLVGYQVTKSIALGVGADVQRLVNENDLLVNVNDEIKTVPGTDIGLTGKTEVSLTERLKAGILYREGVNNFLNSSNQFFDRRYIQVQLKFIVVGK